MEDLKDDFLHEMMDLLELAETALIKQRKSEHIDQDAYNEIFRAFHSIKGAAGMFDQFSLQAHFHELENQLENQNDIGYFNEKTIDYFHQGVDAASDFLNGEVNELNFDHSQYYKLNINKDIDTSEKTEYSHNGLIYIVDDEITILKIVENLLIENNFKVKAFDQAKNLLAELEVEKPDLIISDLNMPEMNGIHLLMETRKRDQDLPFIFLSGYITKEMLLEAIRLNGTAYLDKPFDRNALISQALGAIVSSRTMKTLNDAIKHMIKYYKEVDDYLRDKGKEILREEFKQEIERIIHKRETLGFKNFDFYKKS